MIDDEGAGRVRAELDAVAAAAPAVGFSAADVLGRGRRARRARRGLAVGGSVAALALVVAVPTLVLRDPGPDGLVVAGSASPAPTAAPTPAPTPPEVSPAPAAPPVPGLSAAQADRIARACAGPAGGATAPAGPTVTPNAPGTSTPTPVGTPPASPAVTPAVTPGMTPGLTPPGPGTPSVGVSPPAVTPVPTATGPAATPRGWDGAPGTAAVHVYNRVVDAAGEHVLVYGPQDYLSCDREGSRWTVGQAASQLPTRWLPGPVALDAMSAAPGGVRHSGAGAPSGPGYVLVEGRVSRAVARLTVTVGADTAEVAAVNGTFVVRFVKSATWPATDVGPLTIVPRDRAGRALPGVTPSTKRTCWTDPAGKVVIGDRAYSAGPCRPATPWR
jgi:hypothetical protein